MKAHPPVAPTLGTTRALSKDWNPRPPTGEIFCALARDIGFPAERLNVAGLSSKARTPSCSASHMRAAVTTRVALFTDSGVRASTDTHVAIARADSGQVLPDYLYRYLLSSVGQQQLRSRERGDWTREKIGFRLTELNLRDLQQVPVPLPPFGEQRNVLARLRRWDEEVRRLARLYRAQASALEALAPKLMEVSLSGSPS